MKKGKITGKSEISETLERTVRSRARRDSIRRAFLSTLFIGGALTVAVAAPKVMSLLRKKHIDYFIPPNPKQRLYETASRLKQKGLIEFVEIQGKKRIRLTKAGEAEIRKIEEREVVGVKPKKWDRRWRIVVFDIPESKRALRNRIRAVIRRLGFLRLQDSVWVYPYDCEEVMALLKVEQHIGREVLYIIADAIEFDRPMRKHFELPLE